MNEATSKYAVHESLKIPDAMLAHWQRTVDLMAEVLQVPAGLVMRVHPHEIEVLVCSSNPGNVYRPGERNDLDTGLYCERVMDSRSELLVRDARADPEWAANPDIRLGMVSYCGLPLTWPDGRLFGTICVLDRRDNAYSEVYRRLLAQFRDTVQLGLQTLFENRRLLEAQQALTQAREAAEAANRAKTAFLSTASHELRTPLNAILGMTSLALLQATDDRLVEQLRIVEKASRHLLEVINDVLEISKIEADRVTLKPREFRLAAVLDRVRGLMAEPASAKGLALSFDVDPAVATMPLIGDELRLAQMLLNYVGNAIKFTERGSVSVAVGIDRSDADGVVLRCEVADTGVGIAAADQRRLFGHFEQVGAHADRPDRGTGLGLAINRGLARLMHGEVGLRSEPGRGSLFWFTARLARPGGGDAASAPPRPPPPDALTQLRARTRPARVLVVDDDAANRRVAEDLLAHAGIACDVAANGREALALARSRRHDLVLMDLRMPEVDGFAATQAIRALPGCARLPILALTASAFDEDRRMCLAAGLDDHLAKPVAPAALFEALLKWLPPAAPAQ